MTQPKTKKPFATLAEDLKKIRNRPLTQFEIDKANRVLEKTEHTESVECNDTHDSDLETPKRKIARSPEAEA